MQTRMPVPSVPSDTNSDWDILYPISAFIEAEKFPVIGQALPAGEVLPTIQFQLVENVWDDVLNTRNVTLRIKHDGLIYPGRVLVSYTGSRVTDGSPLLFSHRILCRGSRVVLPDRGAGRPR
jgi:hypothetical protein